VLVFYSQDVLCPKQVNPRYLHRRKVEGRTTKPGEFLKEYHDIDVILEVLYAVKREGESFFIHRNGSYFLGILVSATMKFKVAEKKSNF
jgi:hypothetical protein